MVDAFQNEIDRRVKCVFPDIKMSIKKRSTTVVEFMGFNKESDRETLNGILQEVWEGGSWH
nr:DinI family protein [Pantoea alhagi]